MSSKVSPRQIVTDHYATLYNHATGRRSLLDWGLAWGLPFAGGLWVFVRGDRVTDFGQIVAGAAVLTGFTFGLLIFVFQLRLECGRSGEAPTNGVLAGLLNELFTNVAYATFIGLATTVMVVVSGAIGPATPPGAEHSAQLGPIASAVCVVLGGHFLMTLLMCLKRTYVAYDRSARNK